MVTTLKKGASQKEIQELFLELDKKRNSQGGFDAHKFCGTIKFEEDALEIQKIMRDEWE